MPKTERPGLDKALGQLRKGDVLVIWKLDRLGRSLSHLLSIIEGLEAEECRLCQRSGWLRHLYRLGEDGVLGDRCDG